MGRRRVIKIQCPGVTHADVSGATIFNGTTITIARKQSEGFEALEWSSRFQFKITDGHFRKVRTLGKGGQPIWRWNVSVTGVFGFPPHVLGTLLPRPCQAVRDTVSWTVMRRDTEGCPDYSYYCSSSNAPNLSSP